MTDGGAELMDMWPIGLGGQVTERVGLTATERILKSKSDITRFVSDHGNPEHLVQSV